MSEHVIYVLSYLWHLKQNGEWTRKNTHSYTGYILAWRQLKISKETNKSDNFRQKTFAMKEINVDDGKEGSEVSWRSYLDWVILGVRWCLSCEVICMAWSIQPWEDTGRWNCKCKGAEAERVLEYLRTDRRPRQESAQVERVADESQIS